VVRLKFKTAVDAVFTVSEKKLALLQAESSAPGKEISIILAARKRFDG